MKRKIIRAFLDHWSKMKFWLLTIGKDNAYKEYLHVQFLRSYGKKDEKIHLRTELLVDKIIELISFSSLPKVLCVGCRNTQELDCFQSKGITEVIGIDLFSESPNILVMDMHEMDFMDHEFDVIYCSHSLEHAYDPKKVVKEIIRVACLSAIIAIEVPVHYETRGSDLFDFENTENIHKLFGKSFRKALWYENLPAGHPRNDGGTDVARTIFKIGSNHGK